MKCVDYPDSRYFILDIVNGIWSRDKCILISVINDTVSAFCTEPGYITVLASFWVRYRYIDLLFVTRTIYK